jgi:hypothetical protein
LVDQKENDSQEVENPSVRKRHVLDLSVRTESVSTSNKKGSGVVRTKSQIWTRKSPQGYRTAPRLYRDLKIRLIYEYRCDEILKTKNEESTHLTDTGLVVELEHLKTKTRLIDEKFVSVRGECETSM